MLRTIFPLPVPIVATPWMTGCRSGLRHARCRTYRNLCPCVLWIIVLMSAFARSVTGDTKTSFPEGVGSPVPYGSHLTGLVLYLNTHQLLPVKRLVETLRDLFGVKVSPGTVVNMVSRRAHAYGGLVDTIRAGVVQARVKHMDETGLRIEGR